MILAAMVAYYVLAIGLIFAVAYLTYRQGARRSKAMVDGMIAKSWESVAKTPLLEPYVREPLPELPEPELRITITRHPGADGDRLPQTAAAVIREVSRLEEFLGGDGLDYDPQGSLEEPERVVLRLVPRSADWEAADRLATVADKLNALMCRAKSGTGERDESNIRAQIDRELQPHLPTALIEDVRVTTAPGY